MTPAEIAKLYRIALLFSTPSRARELVEAYLAGLNRQLPQPAKVKP